MPGVSGVGEVQATSISGDARPGSRHGDGGGCVFFAGLDWSSETTTLTKEIRLSLLRLHSLFSLQGRLADRRGQPFATPGSLFATYSVHSKRGLVLGRGSDSALRTARYILHTARVKFVASSGSVPFCSIKGSSGLF